MDVAVSVSSSEQNSLPYDPVHSVNEPPSPSVRAHRNIQYPMSDTSTIHSPRRFHEPAVHRSPTPPSNNHHSHSGMDFASNTLDTPLQNGTQTYWSAHHVSGFPPAPQGQDHDRMETDDESQESDSENGTIGLQEEEQQESPNHSSHVHASYADGVEAMDTTPDGPHAQADQPHEHADSGSTTSATQPPNPPEEDLSQTQLLSTAEASITAHDANATTTTPPSGVLGLNDSPVANVAGVPLDGITVPSPAPPVATDSEGNTSPQQDGTGAGNGGRPEGREEDESQDEDSADEEERAYWADFVEDKSGPDEEELRIIEKNDREINAFNHEHWESLTFEALEDPEYFPSECGRITWTVHPVNGTPEKPNREVIMRSPSVTIGGFRWNIKYYPRGNDGTEQMSVYVECSPSALKETVKESDGGDIAIIASDEAGRSSGPTRNSESSYQAQSSDRTEVSSTETESLTAQQPTPCTIPIPEQGTDENDEDDEDDEEEPAPWEIPAQVGCVVYNPDEPRVNYFRRSSHRFHIDNADWGWTRFHGPWEQIHLRQRNQRQALLRNDTLVFTAYIRTVGDDTKSLWWHAPKHKPGWDSVERIGLRSISGGLSGENVVVAAVSSWLHLAPVRDLIRSLKGPDASVTPETRKRPLLSALQRLAEYMFEGAGELNQSPIADILDWLGWYAIETDQARGNFPEVVYIWEILRRIINFEASNVADMAMAQDFFHDILLLKQPDPWQFERPISDSALSQNSSAEELPTLPEPQSVQQTLDATLTHPSKDFRPWQSFDGHDAPSNEFPIILNVELHRQRYDKNARRWDKLTHRIEINENIKYRSSPTGNLCDYTLYGMIVHAGALESQDFYSVIRPQGPGTRWVRYASGNHHRGVSCLTRTQAVTAHEGSSEKTVGAAAVAYIVLYVRTDSLPTVFPSAEAPSAARGDESSEMVKSTQKDESDKPVRVRIYRSSLFDNHVGRGLPDPWALIPSTGTNGVLDLEFPNSAPLEQVVCHLAGNGKLLRDKAPNSDRPSNCFKWWCLDTGLRSARGLPRFVSPRPEDHIGCLAQKHGGCHLWLHDHYEEPPKVPTNDRQETSDATMTQDEPEVDSLPRGTDEPNVPDGSPDAAMTQDAPTDAPPIDTPTIDMEARRRYSLIDAVLSPPHPPLDQHREATDNQDAVMGEAQETPATADTNAPEPPSAPAPPPIPLIYFFVKIFDTEAQSLQGVRSGFAPLESNISTEVASLLDIQDTLDIYRESSRSVQKHDKIRSSRMFYDEIVEDGCVFIAQRRPSAEKIAALESQGLHATPVGYFRSLLHLDNPSNRAPRRLYSYFGTRYLSSEYSAGVPHGAGTLIRTNGDAYIGNWSHGVKSGHGIMAYATGDTYEGNWSKGEPNGEGKMVYGKTGNVYEGGWRNGRRHGKGVMRYEVADEEMAMCKICYENEMDALFYDCGHVAACEECARQVDACPVCRKNVRAVCRIWRT